MTTSKNPNMKGSGGLQKQFINIMKEQGKPNDLWSVIDMMDASGKTKMQVDNALANAWKSNKITRHRINGDSDTGMGFARYALNLKDTDKQDYVAPVQSHGSPIKRRGIKANAKEIRMAFMNVQNAIAKLEDMIMPVIESAEEKDKALARLKNIL